MKVKIGNKFVGEKEPCLISFEPSSTYKTLAEAKDMIKVSAEAGADAIKFQTFLIGDADRIMGKKDITVDFTTPTGKKQELVYDALKRRELTKDEWKELVEYSKELGILFITSAYFPETINFIAELGIDALKVSKGDVNNVLLVETMAKTGLPVIIDGREKFEDVERDIQVCEKNDNSKIIIMHCPSGYPAENSGVHLSAIKKIQERVHYPVGFADHSPGGLMNYAALTMGAKILEVTITPDKTIENAEHYMSLELHELNEFIKNIRSIEEAMGNPSILEVSRVEESARRSLVAKRDIKIGEKISIDMLDYWRPGDAGISCSEGYNVINKTCIKEVSQGTFLQWNMLE